VGACLEKRELRVRKGGVREVEEGSVDLTCVREGKRAQPRGTTKEFPREHWDRFLSFDRNLDQCSRSGRGGEKESDISDICGKGWIVCSSTESGWNGEQRAEGRRGSCRGLY